MDLVAILIISSATFLVNILHPFRLYSIQFFSTSFLLSMISVYGLRASMVSCFGLLAVALALGRKRILVGIFCMMYYL
jgi:hypothetical protein